MTVRIGVVGGGLVAQAMHIPNLAARPDRFRLTGLAEPSETVRSALGARYGIGGLYTDYRALLDAGDLDAVLIASPAGTHAEVVLAALDAGLHVFVEKPMCITLADADAIVAARERATRVVQVGTMKRFDPAVERMLAELPDSAAGLRYVSVVVNDPEFVPFFDPDDIVRGADVPAGVIAATRHAEAAQVEAAVGSGHPDVVRAFSESFLGSLLHDLNVVHGMLERMGEPLPAEVVSGDWWNEGRAVTGSLRLANGARCDGAWIGLHDTFEYQETISFLFADSVRTLSFPSPWLRSSPTVYRRSEADGRANSSRSVTSHAESFARELEHFHDCIVDGTPCRTPPEGARLDIDVLTRMFLAAARTVGRGAARSPVPTSACRPSTSPTSGPRSRARSTTLVFVRLPTASTRSGSSSTATASTSPTLHSSAASTRASRRRCSWSEGTSPCCWSGTRAFPTRRSCRPMSTSSSARRCR